jgi:uncharacterized membrane protein YdcZ (DUF606 family)
VKQLVTRAQPLIEESGEGFDPGNALESGVGQYPKVGVELVNRFSQTHKFCFLAEMEPRSLTARKNRRSSQSTSRIFAYLICKFYELSIEIPDLQFNRRSRETSFRNRITEGAKKGSRPPDQRRVTMKQFLSLLHFSPAGSCRFKGAVNALLRADLDAPLAVSAVSFVVATAGMVLAFSLATIATEMPKPQMRALPSMPWWGWLGGFVGAYYVVTVFMAIPEIGTAGTVGLTIVGHNWSRCSWIDTASCACRNGPFRDCA